ncbi:MAG: methionyl-tRNA formyltransferase [Candidatus Binatia bacterium]
MRLAILTFESPQANFIIDRLLTRRPGQVCGIVRSDVIVPGKNRWQSMWFILRRTGLGFTARKGAEIMLSRAAAVLSRVTGGRRRFRSLTQMAVDARVPLIGTKDVNDAATLATLRTWQADLVVSVYLNQRIRSPLMELYPGRILNLHGATLPGNRGLFPYFWALVNGDTTGGATVHWVDPGFDTGDVLIEESFPIAPSETVNSLAWKSTRLGADLLLRAIALIEEGTPPRSSQDRTRGRYYSWPTRADVRRLKQRGRRFGSVVYAWNHTGAAGGVD